MLGRYCDTDVNECVLNVGICQNGETCRNHPGNLQCVCVNGLRCHLEDACVSNPCNNGSSKGSLCETSLMDGNPICSCKWGWTGSDCGTDINECNEVMDLCEHGGTCVNTKGGYRCDCSPGFTGSKCEENIKECLSNTCQNAGTCLDDTAKFVCVCMPDDSFKYHNGYSFFTYDRDQDGWSGNCAVDYKGAWWYNNCYYSNLNGIYRNLGTADTGSMTMDWPSPSESLKTSKLSIKPV